MRGRYDVIVVGGGPAGLSAAAAARAAGSGSVLVVERDVRLGGILNQCVHSGFGLITYGEELTGPEYAARHEREALDAGVEALLDATVVGVSGDRRVTLASAREGVVTLEAGAVVLAMGCRERPAGALRLPGLRPAGVYTAGMAQRLVNVEGLLPGREVVILGSGDIGLIMARRLTLEGARVACVAELLPYSGGLKRNVVQCLDDFGIPLLLSHTVTRVSGARRVESVGISRVDGSGRPLPGTEVTYPCDTLLLSVGLIPENELSRAAGVELSAVTRGPVVDSDLETSVPGVFACGNVLHVHDLVDYVSEEAARAGRAAAEFADAASRGEARPRAGAVPVLAGEGVRSVVPQLLRTCPPPEEATLRFRVDGVYERRRVTVRVAGRVVSRRLRDILVPGEMEQVTLAHADLEGAQGPVTVSLEEG